MIDIKDINLHPYLLLGKFGLEKEMLRTTEEGFFAQTMHQFTGRDNIVRDFCENQLEINTKPHSTIEGVFGELESIIKEVQTELSKTENRELLWPFSNPPFINKDSEIKIAQFYGEEARKTEYREYLASRYGKYKMSLSGIHFNYSFDEELIKLMHKSSSIEDYRTFKDSVYLELARKLTVYGWLITVLTAASPILDSSYNEKGNVGGSNFSGMASVRCSELGYWNHFAPVFDYSNTRNYVESIRGYVNEGYIAYPSELYYPIRLKPKGVNNLESLEENGINHIEIRNIDNNPLIPVGIDIKDAIFIHLLFIWLMSLPDIELSNLQQIDAVSNFKNAAHYDLKTVTISMPGFETKTIADAGVEIINAMSEFYKAGRNLPHDYKEVLEFEREKLIYPEKRYAWQIKEQYQNDYVLKGIDLAKKYRDYYSSEN